MARAYLHGTYTPTIIEVLQAGNQDCQKNHLFFRPIMLAAETSIPTTTTGCAEKGGSLAKPAKIVSPPALGLLEISQKMSWANPVYRVFSKLLSPWCVFHRGHLSEVLPNFHDARKTFFPFFGDLQPVRRRWWFFFQHGILSIVGKIEKRYISEEKSSMLRVDENMVDGNVVWLRIYSSSLACCGIAVEEKKGEGGGTV